MSNTVHNERVKLLATVLNAMAGSCFTVGVAAPIAATFFYNPTRVRLATVVVGIIFWLVATAMLHLGAYQVLGRLSDE
jgi:phage shock protein PspC (stress-responsive transcriptional regulator)